MHEFIHKVNKITSLCEWNLGFLKRVIYKKNCLIPLHDSNKIKLTTTTLCMELKVCKEFPTHHAIHPINRTLL
jgi:hypothetical protein